MKLSAFLAVGVAAAALLPVSAARAAPMALVGGVGNGEAASFSFVLPLRDKPGLEALVSQLHDPSSPRFHQWLTPEQVMDRFGPSTGTVAAAEAALRARGLTVQTTGRLLRVSGSGERIAALLGAPLARGRTANGHVHVFATAIPTLPAALRALNGLVLGLSADPHEAHTYARRTSTASAVLADPRNRYGTTGTYWYDDLKQAYQYPSYQTTISKGGRTVRLDGTGATVGIVMSSDIYDSDVSAVFDHEKFKAHSGQSKNPTLYKRVPVDGGATTGSDALDEASLDVQEAITGAPGSHVILYNMPTLSDANIVDAYVRVLSDNEADVVSSSFGACELFYTAAYNNGVDDTAQIELEHELFLQGNAQGITFLASSGDNAGLECPSVNNVTQGTAGRFVRGVSVPAADPNVTAVGGTNVVTASSATTLDSSYVRENAYGDPLVPYDAYGTGANLSGGYWGAGGGVSTLFGKPDFQSTSGINTGSNAFRALPDIGMQVGGCPGGISQTPCNGGNSPLDGNGNTERSAVVVSIAGQFAGLIGTSVASPELAGALALLVEQYGRMGNLNPTLYTLGQAQTKAGTNNIARASTVFHRSIPGYNGVNTNNQPVNVSGAYYNYTVGVGTPIVYRLVGAPSAAPAGVPQSASNP
ncbi:MAG: S8 family serine peptidase [Gluconacetobacter diazotrophicus]|nr:S8 family serine peptidase [Gluconacetobacter diazotrophicus]